MKGIYGNTAYPYGFGGFSDFTNGTPAPANFFGQTGWWTVPLSWFSMTDANGQIFVSPNSDFSDPRYACKINVDGTMVFQSLAQPIAKLPPPPDL